MNRRIVFSVSVFALALCLAIIALPVTPVGATNPMQGTAAPENPCVPKPNIPGTIVADAHVVFSQASEASKQLMIVKRDDVVDVLGTSKNGVWIEILSNAGIAGWVPSAYVLVDRKLLGHLPVVDGTVDAVAPVSTMAATMAGTAAPAVTMAATEALINPACPGIPGTITGDALSLKTLPKTQSADEGTIVKSGQQVQVVELNSSGSWFRIVYKGHTGWVGSAYVFIKPGASVQVPHNYTDVEITMTPVGQ